MKNKKTFEVVYDLPWHKDNIATVEAHNHKEAEQIVADILARDEKGKVRKGCVRISA